jgi:hypothetical protein
MSPGDNDADPTKQDPSAPLRHVAILTIGAAFIVWGGINTAQELGSGQSRIVRSTRIVSVERQPTGYWLNVAWNALPLPVGIVIVVVGIRRWRAQANTSRDPMRRGPPG